MEFQKEQNLSEIGITEQHIKEMLSRAYVQALAGKCGLNLKKGELDYGIDGTFAAVKIRTKNGEKRRVESGFNLDFQLKASENIKIENDSVKYNLEVKNYNDLVDEEVGTPRILIVYKVPKKREEWVKISDTQMILNGSAWWVQLKGKPESNNTHKKTIHIPKEQVLTEEALLDLMGKIERGEL